MEYAEFSDTVNVRPAVAAIRRGTGSSRGWGTSDAGNHHVHRRRPQCSTAALRRATDRDLSTMDETGNTHPADRRSGLRRRILPNIRGRQGRGPHPSAAPQPAHHSRARPRRVTPSKKQPGPAHTKTPWRNTASEGQPRHTRTNHSAKAPRPIRARPPTRSATVMAELTSD